MQTTLSDPSAPGLGRARIARLMDAVAGSEDPDAVEVRWSGAHSNDVYDLRLDDGRRLVLKRGRHDWARERFATSRSAAGLLGDADILVPQPLPLPDDLDARPLQAYWRIPLVTLESLWPELSAPARASAMRTWGELLARLHRVRLDGWGGLGASEAPVRELEVFLKGDIGGRLLPACQALWPAAVAPLRRLFDLASVVASRANGRRATLVHNDLHMGNVLCRVEAEDVVRCVGFLDLEAVRAMPPEADAGSLEALHGPLFTQHLSPRWRARVWVGYGARLDPATVGYFRALHLANLGFHSALIGHHEHAELVARALHGDVARLDQREPGASRSDRRPRR